jgi:hypothetical protein
MPEFNHQQDDSPVLAAVIACLGLILFVGAFAAIAWICL